MQLICDRATGIALESLYSDQPKRMGEQIHGSALDVALTVVDRIANPITPRLFEPVDISGYSSVYAAAGTGFRLPVAGSWRIRSGINQTAGPLVVGKRYKITGFQAGDDFANVGASSNDNGVIFTASGITPTTWTNASALQEVTASLAHDAGAAAVQSALDATRFISDAGGIVVELEAAGYFIFTFIVEGARVEMVGEADN